MAAEQVTKWILEFVDEVTKPVRDAVKSVDTATQAIDEMTNAVKFSEKETKHALSQSKDHYKDLQKQVSKAELEMDQLKIAAKDAAGVTNQKKAIQAYEESRKKVERLRVALKGAKVDVDDLKESAEDFAKETTSWSDIAIGANQGVELVQKAIDGLDFTVDVAKLTTQIERMTDATGAQLDSMVKKTRNVAAVYEEDAQEIARAANTMTEQIGGSYEENLALIEQGYQKGANINGDFLDQLKEYPTFIKQLGLSQSQAIALIAQAGKKGVFSDKAIDSLKEANLSLREMGKTQIDALAGIKMKPEDIVDKSPFEAMKLIVSKMKGMAPQARQMILTDLFKGAGEDAGLAFIESLATMDLDLTKLKSVEEAGAGIKSFFSDVSTEIAQMFGDVGVYAQQLAPVFQIIAAGIPIINAMTASQWSLNVALDANPVGAIIIAIVALIALVTAIILKYEEWGAALALVIGPLGWIINLIMSFKKHWDSITDAFTNGGIIAGLKRIGLVLLDALLYPVQQLLELLAKIPGMGKLAGKGANYMREMRENLQLTEGDKKPDEQKEEDPSVNAYATGDKNTLGKVVDPAKKGKEGDGLNVGSGSNGIKSIVMNLDVKNYFNVSHGTDARAIADKVVGHVNDRLRDAVINLGG